MITSYRLSKLALNGATIMLSQSLAARDIVCNAICPGWVRTDMGELLHRVLQKRALIQQSG